MTQSEVYFAVGGDERRGMALVYRDRGTSGTQLAVMTGTVTIGHIGKEMFSDFSGGGDLWRWSLYIDRAVASGVVRAGSAGSLEAAKTDLAWNWLMWLDAAGLTER